MNRSASSGLKIVQQAIFGTSKVKRLLRLSAIISLQPLVAGCVAVPVVAGAAMLAGSERASTRGAAPVLAPTQTAMSSPKSQFELLPALTRLPAPVAPSDEWELFVDYALERSFARGGDKPLSSAVLAPVTSATLYQPRGRNCTAPTPAVIIDLDEGPTTFSANEHAIAAPGLAKALSRLRDAGVVTLWISSAKADDVTQVAEALHASGLDPERRDPLLLALGEGGRKQVMREEANEDVCVVAIAGDERNDFDELFDHLHDPAYGNFVFELFRDKGWFLLPAPLAAPIKTHE